MGYSFRFRFKTSKNKFINIEENIMILSSDGTISTKLKSIEKEKDIFKSIKSSNEFCIISSGYTSENEAKELGLLYKQFITSVFCKLRIGLNFGERMPKSFITKYGLEMIAQEINRNTIFDSTEVQVYPTDLDPIFVKVNQPIVSITTSNENFEDAVKFCQNHKIEITETKRLAFELFSASTISDYTDSRFLLLMMAIETLIVPEERHSDELTFINRFILELKDSFLNSKQSLISTLNHLKQESIGSAGRKLSSKLSGNYYEMTPNKFFMLCYEIRSKLVHGHVPRPDIIEMGNCIAELERFVSDLILLE